MSESATNPKPPRPGRELSSLSSVSMSAVSSIARRLDPRYFDTGTRGLVFIVCGLFASAVVTGLLVRAERRAERALVAERRAEILAGAVEGARALDLVLRPVEHMAQELAGDLSAGRLPYEAIDEKLRALLESAPAETVEVGVAFAPFAFRPDARLHAPHCTRASGAISFYQREQYGDYLGSPWYQDALSRGGGWNEPEVGHFSRDLIVHFSVPFYRPEGGAAAGAQRTAAGVVRMNVAISRLRHVVGGLTGGRTRYGFLLSALGRYLSHPDDRLVAELQSFFDGSGARRPATAECVRRALAGQTSVTDDVEELRGRDAWIACVPVQSARWALALVHFREEILPLASLRWRPRVRLLLSSLLMVTFLFALLCRLHLPTPRRLWGASLATSGALVIGTVSLMLDLRERQIPPARDHVEVFDHATLESFEKQHEATMGAASGGKAAAPPLFVPTGLFISTVNLSRPGEVVVTGQAWQKYPLGAAAVDRADQGIVFPDAEQAVLSPTYTQSDGETTTAGFSFRLTIRRPFSDSSRYPFDAAVIPIRMWHKAFHKNLVLVPDLDAYPSMIPSALPGVDGAMEVPGWALRQSFFEYVPAQLRASFGLSGVARNPELWFNVVARRELIDPLFTSLMPVAAALAVLFILLMCAARDDKARSRLGFDPMKALAAAASMMFVVLVAQTNLRSRVGATEVTFLEYFYFAVYITIVGVAINSISLARISRVSLMDFHDNLIARVVFWPATFLAQLLITVLVFY